MMMLPMKMVMMITVVMPSSALPTILSISAQMPNTTDIKSITKPRTVTVCIGAVEYDEMLEIAYLISPRVDHLDWPPTR